ncbi:hypothetical protein C5C67_13875, partial [Rathayibacter sp. AY1E1]
MHRCPRAITAASDRNRTRRPDSQRQVATALSRRCAAGDAPPQRDPGPIAYAVSWSNLAGPARYLGRVAYTDSGLATLV